jgi:molybdopterin converting factor small subunit
MKNMKSSENRKFEDAWKEAFADAEGNVSDSVWNNIDSQLARAESGDMKKRVFFYKWLAAASVVFALVVGGVFVYRSSLEDKVGSRQYAVGKGEVDKGQSSIAEAKEDKLAVGKSGEVDKGQLTVDNGVGKVGSIGEADSRVMTADNGLKKIGNGQKEIGKNRAVDNGMLISKSDEQKGKDDEKILREQLTETVIAKTQELSKEETKLPTEASTNEVALNQEVVTVIPTKNILKQADTVAFIESPIKIAKVEEKKSQEEKSTTKKEAEENWWAAVSGSAGSYNPNGASTPTSLPSSIPQFNYGTNSSRNNSASLGTAYSYGVNFGKRIAPRWMLISGVGFLSQSINYSSSQAIFSSAQKQSLSDDASRLSAASVTPISVDELSSVNEFITVPLQAGYLIINKKVGVQLNAGVASDIFIRNSLVDPTGKLSTSTQSAGESSTYKTINWTGLVGTELSYKISNHYRLAVIPGMRYSFDSILKPTVGSTITPLIWDVGFRFKYIF